MKNQTTGKAVSTLTPESSEAPRESRGDVGLLERFDGLAAQIADGPRRLNETADKAMGKTSSPELASLAAKYLNMTDEGFETRLMFDDGFVRPDYVKELLRDVRALAASVLAQAEGTPRK
jgi:hypothetical protein